MPCFVIFSTRVLLLSRYSGRVHHPFLIRGASLGAYLTDTIAWSVGMANSLISQSKVKGSAFLEIYIQSSLACMQMLCVWALYVKAFLVGFAHRHVSLISHSCLTSLRAAITDLSSSLGGILSMASSVMLKSPRVRSGIRRHLDCLLVRIFAQKPVCSLLSFGA